MKRYQDSESRLLRLSYVQLILYVATWLAGIYVNGFVPSPSDTGGSTVDFFLSHAVITHFVLGALTAAVGIMLLASGWIYEAKRFTLFTGLSLASIAIAGTGGLSFVFGIGNPNLDSMVMGTSFISAVYLSFFAILSIRGTKIKRVSRLIQNTSIAALVLFYAVFVSGIYLNIFVASTVFSEPPSIEQKMLGQMVISPSALFHEASGTALLVLMIILTIGLLRTSERKMAFTGLASTLLVLYSLLVGAFENIEPVLAPTSSLILTNPGSASYILSSEVVPLLSAAGFLIALMIVMTIARVVWRQKTITVSRPKLQS